MGVMPPALDGCTIGPWFRRSRLASIARVGFGGGFPELQSCVTGPSNPWWGRDAVVGVWGEANGFVSSPNTWDGYAPLGSQSVQCDNFFTIMASGPGLRNQDVFVLGFFPNTLFDWTTEGNCGHQHLAVYLFGYHTTLGWRFLDS